MSTLQVWRHTVKPARTTLAIASGDITEDAFAALLRADTHTKLATKSAFSPINSGASSFFFLEQASPALPPAYVCTGVLANP